MSEESDAGRKQASSRDEVVRGGERPAEKGDGGYRGQSVADCSDDSVESSGKTKCCDDISEDLGADTSLMEGRRRNRDRWYERWLVWVYGDTLVVLVTVGAVVAVALIAFVAFRHQSESLPDSLLAEMELKRSAARQCMASEMRAGGEGFESCPFGVGGSVAAGRSIVLELFTVECGIMTVLGVWSRKAVRRGARSGVVAAETFGSLRGAMLFWVPVCIIWSLIFYACLVWSPSPAALEEELFLVLTLAAPMWAAAVASVFLPLWLYWHVVDYDVADIRTRRREVRNKYAEMCRLLMMKRRKCALGSEIEGRQGVCDYILRVGRSKAPAERLCLRWAMVFLSIFLTAFAGVGEFWVLGAVPPAAMISAFYACIVILGRSRPKKNERFYIMAAYSGYAIIFIFLWAYVAYYGGVIMVSDGVLRLGSGILVAAPAIICEAVLLGLLTWLWVLAVWGREAARHPVSVVRARRAMRCSDELVWLRKQEKEISNRRRRELLQGISFSAALPGAGGR